MSKMVWASVVAVGAFVAGALACSSSSSGSGNSAFPFSGPSCMGGPPGTQQVSAACTSCVDNACASQFSCIKTDCADYYNCICACQPGDGTCASKCTMSSACSSCNSAAGQCLISANSQACASDCGGGSSSGGASSSGSSGGSSGGSSSGSSGGGTATGSCATLMTCCGMLPSAEQSACTTAAGYNLQQACSAALGGFQDAGMCH